MLKWINKKRNNKGFTLVELVVVIAILGILAAIAIPRFTGIQARATINADAASAQEMISAARIIEAEQGSRAADPIEPGTALTSKGEWNDKIKGADTYMELPSAPKSGGEWKVEHSPATESGKYVITWEPTGQIIKEQKVTEGNVFEVNQ